MAYSVNISVEAPIENQIQEITYDGQEIYQAYVLSCVTVLSIEIINRQSIDLNTNEFILHITSNLSVNTMYLWL